MDLDTIWPADIDMPGSPEHLEAIGALGLFYNELEMALYAIFAQYLPKPTRDFLYAELHNRNRVDLLRIFAASEDDPEITDAINHALKGFDLCCENRNLVLHAFTYGAASNGVLTLVKARSSAYGMLAHYGFTAEKIRDAAVSTSRLCDYVFRLTDVMTARHDAVTEAIAQLPLPEKPPQPRKLSLSRLPEDRPDE